MRLHIQFDRHRITKDRLAADFDIAIRKRFGKADSHTISYGSSAEELIEALGRADIAIFTFPPPRPLPVAVPELKMIFCTFAGIDALLPLDWLPPGVRLLNNAGAHGPKAGEFAIMSMLMLANHMQVFSRQQKEQRWNRITGRLLEGRRLTVIGLGGLGTDTARRAKQFDMHVTGIRAMTRPNEFCDEIVLSSDIDSVLPSTEFLVLACPLTDKTRQLLDARRIALLPKGAFVINVARGELIDQKALCNALADGYLGGAVLDVFTPEPVPPGHSLWTTQNLVMTPHVSANDSQNYMQRSFDIFMENLEAYQQGNPMPNEVNIERGY